MFEKKKHLGSSNKNQNKFWFNSFFSHSLLVYFVKLLYSLFTSKMIILSLRFLFVIISGKLYCNNDFFFIPFIVRVLLLGRAFEPHLIIHSHFSFIIWFIFFSSFIIFFCLFELFERFVCFNIKWNAVECVLMRQFFSLYSIFVSFNFQAYSIKKKWTIHNCFCLYFRDFYFFFVRTFYGS